MMEYNGQTISGYEEGLAQRAQELGLTLYFGANFISVDSKAGKWQLILDSDRTFERLEHKNYRYIKSRATGTGRKQGEFHEQKIGSKSIINALDYIANHDNKLLKKFN